MITETSDSISDNKALAISTDPAKMANQIGILERDILENLYFIQGKSRDLATANDWYMAVAYTVRSRLMKNWIDTLHDLKDKQVKLVGYLSAEFLMGPHLGNAMINLGIYDEVKKATELLGLNFQEIVSREEEPGL